MLPIKRPTTVSSLTLNRDEFLSPFTTLFNEFFNDSFDFLGKDFFDRTSYPKVDVRDEEDKLVIEAEIPGLKKDQISVEVDENNVIRIKGEKKEKSENNKNYVHRELKHSSFCRTFKLPTTVDVGKLTANFENGILEINLPKKVIENKEPTVRKIDIK